MINLEQAFTNYVPHPKQLKCMQMYTYNSLKAKVFSSPDGLKPSKVH